jgi:hypothetical protein
MGARTRGLEMKTGFKRDAADEAARAEAEAVIQRWNDQLTLGRDMLRSPTVRAALLSRAIDVRTIDGYRLASRQNQPLPK